jgi:hypothetical protein
VTLGEVLAESARELDDAEAYDAAGGTEWRVRGRPFAAVSGATADFALDPIVARAALGTPDTAPSSRGGEWVSLSARDVDQLVVDRAVAWFGSAYRRAAGDQRRT